MDGLPDELLTSIFTLAYGDLMRCQLWRPHLGLASQQRVVRPVAAWRREQYGPPGAPAVCKNWRRVFLDLFASKYRLNVELPSWQRGSGKQKQREQRAAMRAALTQLAPAIDSLTWRLPDPPHDHARANAAAAADAAPHLESFLASVGPRNRLRSLWLARVPLTAAAAAALPALTRLESLTFRGGEYQPEWEEDSDDADGEFDEHGDFHQHLGEYEPALKLPASLPAALARLPILRHLDLAAEAVPGPLPPHMLSRLVTLDLDASRARLPLPLPPMPALRRLVLKQGGNSVSLALPRLADYPALVQLKLEAQRVQVGAALLRPAKLSLLRAVPADPEEGGGGVPSFELSLDGVEKGLYEGGLAAALAAAWLPGAATCSLTLTHCRYRLSLADAERLLGQGALRLCRLSVDTPKVDGPAAELLAARLPGVTRRWDRTVWQAAN